MPPPGAAGRPGRRRGEGRGGTPHFPQPVSGEDSTAAVAAAERQAGVPATGSHPVEDEEGLLRRLQVGIPSTQEGDERRLALPLQGREFVGQPPGGDGSCGGGGGGDGGGEAAAETQRWRWAGDAREEAGERTKEEVEEEEEEEAMNESGEPAALAEQGRRRPSWAEGEQAPAAAGRGRNSIAIVTVVEKL